MPRHALIPLIIACALFMETLDSTVISTSLPVIATDLRQDPIALKLALTSYLLSLAIFIPVSGWMADRYGARVIFRAAIGIFTLGSILCGLSGSLGGFVAARIVQGAGGAMMVPVGRLIILRSVPKSELGSALAWVTAPALVGPLMGPPLGGFITTTFNWRWIFFINVPIGLIGILLASRFIDNIREPGNPPLDVTGAVLSAMGLSGLVFGLALLGQRLAPVEASLAIIAAGAVATVLWWWKRCVRPKRTLCSPRTILARRSSRPRPLPLPRPLCSGCCPPMPGLRWPPVRSSQTIRRAWRKTRTSPKRPAPREASGRRRRCKPKHRITRLRLICAARQRPVPDRRRHFRAARRRAP